jgi:CheY-like chemotaxis protein
MRRPLRPLSERRPRRSHITAEQLAALSHEFRTPLNGVLGMARLLEGTRLTAEQRAYAVALRESGQHLLTLVNDVLDFAKLGAGGLELQPAEVDLGALLRSVAELMSPRAREKGLEIGWQAAPDLRRVYADEGRVKQILLNFAGNAVKFTKTGGVLLAVEEADSGRLRFTVEDTGPGVSEAQRERIFEAFAQADAAHAEIGTGLGLAIARRLAQAMDGEVGVDSAREGGAVFWFEADFPRLAATPHQTPLTGRMVAVASGNPVVLKAARGQIEACGGRAVTAADLPSLLETTGAGDILLIDHGLLAAGPPPAPPADRRCIVLLGTEERERVEAYRRAGWAGYLIKPLRQSSLCERVLIAAGETPQTGSEAEDERVAAAAAPGVKVLVVEDHPVNALLARALLTREGCEVDHVASGQEALSAVQVGAYDLILMDMRMPGLSGIETAARLRELGVAAPIVALTANAFEEDRQACLAAGMDDFLVKPLSPDSLRAVLTRWARGRWTDEPARAKVG